MRGAMSVLVLTLVTSIPLGAQTPAGGGVSGIVRDEQNAVVPGVTVAAASESAPRVYRTITDRTGLYHLPDLAPGEYDITAELTGFATFKRPSVVVRTGLTVKVDVIMKVGGIGETVEVRMETPLLETRHGSPSVNVSGGLLRSVPLTERREWSARSVSCRRRHLEFSGSKLLYVRGSGTGCGARQVDGADVPARRSPA